MWEYNQSTQLYHYGVLGMRWGRSKKSSISNKKGSSKKSTKSMTDEELASSVKRLSLEKTHNELSKSGRKTSGMEKSKKVIDATSTLVTQAKTLSKESVKSSTKKEKLDLSKMTDQQLRERINRTNLEKQYNDMFAKETSNISKGQARVSNILDVGGTVLAVGSSSLAIALAIKELRR